MAGDVTAQLKFDGNGLISAVVQDAENGQVLMVAYMDAEAVRRTLTSGRTCFYSRSRQSYWVKGETSGNTQAVVQVLADCDRDCILVRVRQLGAACHLGFRSCFAHEMSEDAIETIDTPIMDAY
jgi:phosphoribosyl-AMP cyclohydrolase